MKYLKNNSIIKMLNSRVKVSKNVNFRSAKTEAINLGSTPVFHNTEIFKGFDETYIYDEDDWLLIGDGCGKQEYFRRRGMRKTCLKWGQMKLFITELQFLNKYWNPEEVPNPTCVYVGAATGNHIVFLARMFPQIKFHLYDGREFDPRLSKESNVRTYVKLFTDEDAKFYSGRSDILFISDIRSLSYDIEGFETEESQRKNEEIAAHDMKLQMDWVIKIKPVKAHLKFRLPYSHPWVKETTFTYLDGDVYKQPFAPHTSTETRLVVDMKAPIRNWNFKIYESMMFYHNNVVREHIKFVNPLTGINESISEELGLLQDFDSVVFITTVKEYLIKYGFLSVTDSKTFNLRVLQLAKAIIDDIGAGYVNFVNLRAGLDGSMSSNIKRHLKMMGEDEQE